MGMSNAAVFIKLENSNEFEVDEVVKTLFGDHLEIKTSWESGFDFHAKENVIVSFHSNGIGIMNSEFVNQVLIKRSREAISELYKLFNSPKLIMVYMHYDSGDSFGFGCIQDGFFKRFRYSLSTDWVTHDFGQPFDEELNILNGPIYYEEDEYGDREYLYKRLDDPKNPKSYHFINSEIANEVMKNKIGYGFYDENVEAKSYYITLKPNEKQMQQNPNKTKPKGLFGKMFEN
jgi:hypothetical protein